MCFDSSVSTWSPFIGISLARAICGQACRRLHSAALELQPFMYQLKLSIATWLAVEDRSGPRKRVGRAFVIRQRSSGLSGSCG